MAFIYRDKLPQTKRSGIYSITNTVNGKVYVGSAVSITGRLKAHRWMLQRGDHGNIFLQRAWNKYGEKNFKYDVLELCEVSELDVREQHWMDYLKVCNQVYGYNLCPTAGSKRGFKCSEATKLKISKANSGKSPSEETRKRMSEARIGKQFTEEHKETLKANHWTKSANAEDIIVRAAAKRRGGKRTPEQRRNISAGCKRKAAERRDKRREEYRVLMSGRIIT